MNPSSATTIISEILREEIREKEEVIFIPSPGNGGDALISFQAYQLLVKLNVKFTAFHHENLPISFDGKVVIIGGGGGLVPHYKVLPELLSKAAASAKKVIVLPQSVRGLESLLGALSQRVHLLTRDRISLDHVSRNATNAHVYASEDLALSIDIEKLFSKPPSTIKYLLHQLSISKYHFRIGTQRTLSWIFLLIITRLHQVFTGDRTLIAIRSDVEATISPPSTRRNVDISSELEYNDMSEIGAELTSYRMLKFIALHDKVITNRLHVGIGAHLLGLKLKLIDNSYGKISAVYKQSLMLNPKIALIEKPIITDFN